ncbi:uncharacterized protein LOC119723185 [Patiria miniata]|uniref:DUF5641 domain-containing protein n=1 Tax=Patiria miniata TaxID=46514 RepID=A0A913ZD11_PATMI|nr:uncharacterized protein LOC119723185 [Patiria miniata]
MHGRYKTEIENLLDKGYAERVLSSDIDASPGGTWYLPHHNVVNPNKPEKLRIVFDCAAEYAGTSLNKNVMQGLDMTNKLIGVLVRFREQRVAVMGDIEAMFYQVKVTPSHRDVLRFLWWRDGDIANQPEVFRMAVHLFGGVWCPSCASYALHRTAEDHKDEFDPEVITTVMENFYADDCLKSVENDEKAMKLVEQLCKLLSMGGFRLTKWLSNSRKLIESIPLEERAKSAKEVDLDNGLLPVERALGVHWDTHTDVLGIKIKPKEKGYTRRGLLSIVSSVYDPLGFVCPFVLQAKKIFQDECKRGKDWDDELEPGNLEQWMKWLQGLPKLEEFSVPRCIVPREFGTPTSVQLHHFCDVSMVAYGAVSYIRLVDNRGHIHTSFLMGKSRLAPMKSMTIPRLELSAAVMAVRMDSILQREMRLEVQSTTFWTDSQIVLQYIKNTSKRFQTFVTNRVNVIHDGSLPAQWRYVDTRSNPADDASRGLDAKQILCQPRWKQGPAFLSADETAWSVEPEASPDLLQDDKEVKHEAKTCAVEAVAPDDLINTLLKRYSSWLRLKKTVAWLLRFKAWLRNHRQQEPEVSLQVHDLQAAEKAIIAHLQEKHFGEEVRALKTNGTISRKSAVYSLDPVVDDDGLLRVGGRLKMAPLTEQAKHPLIVPREHHVTELIIRHYHERKSAHSGREYVLCLTRERFWIPRARPLINRVLRDCVVCRRIRGKTCAQRMADLPKGVWERQIRTVRKVINSLLKDQVLDDERLDTLFCEVESVVNGRPVTPVSDSPDDAETLTPNHLLLLRAGQPAPTGNFIKQDAYGRRWRHVQLLADQFWKRWIREYLPTLQLRRKWIDPQRNVVAGDTVLIMEETTPRRNWPLGLITRTFPGKDGLVRTAEVKTRQNIVVRPVDKLCLLESAD